MSVLFALAKILPFQKRPSSFFQEVKYLVNFDLFNLRNIIYLRNILLGDIRVFLGGKMKPQTL